MYQKKIINKIPGNLLSPFKKENQGYIEDLGKKQKFELEELLERQNKILDNKQVKFKLQLILLDYFLKLFFFSRTLILKLPDKGEKIKSFRNQILKEIEHRNEVEKAANLLSRLNLASEGKVAMNELEWTGKYEEIKDTTKIIELDSDDEEDPLKILAQVNFIFLKNYIIFYILKIILYCLF